ncbi:MAG: fibronectin type III domain-containing protein, partial [Thermoplasmata archaeon]
LTWEAPTSDGGSRIANYSIYRGTTPGGETFLLEVGSVLEYMDSNLTNGQKYYYRVSAINAAGEGPQSNEASATPATVPDAPTGLAAFGGDGEVILTWDPPLITGGLSITNYRIYRGDTPGAGTLIFQTLDIETYTNKGLTNGQAYYYQVSAVNNVGEGPRSNETMVIPTSIPGAPGAFQANLDGKALENVTLTWSLSIDDGGSQNSVINYMIFRGSTFDAYGSGYELLILLPNGTSEFTDNLVGEGDPNNYFYQVCALDLNYKVNCSENQAGKFTRHLPEGQNLVSIPLIQSDESIEAVLQTVAFGEVWFYDPFSQEWKSSVKSKPYRRSLELINHTIGFWINITEESNLTVAGVVPSTTTIHLKAGWNLVGIPPFVENWSIEYLRALVSVGSVEGFDSSDPPYYLRTLQDSDNLRAGYGYWVWVAEDSVWNLSST